MLVFSAVILKMYIRITNREDPDQTASALFVYRCLFGMQLVLRILEHLPYKWQIL